jgi:hypothetical protein
MHPLSTQQPEAGQDFDRCIAPQQAGKPGRCLPDSSVGAIRQADAHADWLRAQYLRDLTAADALGDRCFFDAMGEVIAARLNGRTR